MPAPERNCFPKSGKLTPNHDKNTLKLAYLWSSSDLHWHDITSAEFCHGDTVFSIAQLVMRKLLFSYLIFLRCDMFFVNQVALFFNLNFLRCVILHSLECFLYLLSHNNRFVVTVDTTPGSEMCRCIIIFTFSSISLIRITFYSHGRHHSEC